MVIARGGKKCQFCFNVLLLLMLILCAAFTVGEVVGVRPSKIVAGQEVEKTNEFLQILANAVLKKVFSRGLDGWMCVCSVY